MIIKKQLFRSPSISGFLTFRCNSSSHPSRCNSSSSPTPFSSFSFSSSSSSFSYFSSDCDSLLFLFFILPHRCPSHFDSSFSSPSSFLLSFSPFSLPPPRCNSYYFPTSIFQPGFWSYL